MVRSMYSGVSGLRSHQTRMDTIGNNIANVNTYGFKGSRTTFRDIYYQTMNTASAPTANLGGMNPSAVGYGAKVGSVDLMMGRSTLTMTDQTMDLAIDGDGFLQVMDGAGNKYYTRAGMLNFDAVGNLVDMQGNFVLGVNGDPTGVAASSNRITVSLPDVPPTQAYAEQSINSLQYRISAANATKEGNVNFTFSVDPSLTDGAVTAQISATGINIKMHPQNSYASFTEFNDAINQAITIANGNKPHPAGDFTVEAVGHDPFANGPLSAATIVSTDYGIQLGKAPFPAGQSFFGGISATGKVGVGFAGEGAMGPMDCAFVPGPPDKWEVSLNIGGATYKGSIDSTKTGSGKFDLVGPGGSTDTIEMKRPSFADISTAWSKLPGNSGTQPEFQIAPPATAGNPGDTISIALNGGTPFDIVIPAGMTTLSAQTTFIANAIRDKGEHTVTVDGSGNIIAKSKTARVETPMTISNWGSNDAVITNPVPGVAPAVLDGTSAFDQIPTTDFTEDAVASAPSTALGFGGSSFALRKGTEGGPQGISDMTGISIAPNGVITGWDSQGEMVTIGRIDLATFANQSGLAQAGNTNFAETANSGTAKLTQPGSNGAGKLVGGSLELSNVDLSREFSDMITTQRGYQANSRIITVSDTMLEELINLKR